MKHILESVGIGFLALVFVVAVASMFVTETTTNLSLLIVLCIALITGIAAGIITYIES